MTDYYDHMSLPFVPEDFLHKKRASKGFAPYRKQDRDESELFEKELQSFADIQKAHKIIKNKYKEFIDPSLIIKIKVNQSVPEDIFRKDLERANIEVISAAPDKKGYWIVFSDDSELKDFQRKYNEHIKTGGFGFFYAIDGISPIPPEDKIGVSLRSEPFKDREISNLDVEIWRMDTSHIMKFLSSFKKLVENKNGKIMSEFITNTFFLLKIKCTKELYHAMLELPEIAYVDRPPKINLEVSLQKDIKDFSVDGEPPEEAAGILVVDSGILAGHPLLENAVADEIVSETSNGEIVHGGNPSDDVGHGTKVAGIALYGDIEKCIIEETFHPEVWIFSAKVMFKGDDGSARYNENDLLVKQLFSAVKSILDQYPNCRIVNLSLGDSAKKMYQERRQYPLGSLVDELCKNFRALFVVSSGNIEEELIDLDDYPNYLMDDTSDKAKIIDPASSALALTVGSLCQIKKPSSGGIMLYPSPDTRVGPGYKGMIKPEFIEIGGDSFGRESKVITLNPNWITEGRLFTLESGTSFSTPKIAHYAAKLFNSYPDYTSNLIKALLINSASIPQERPQPLLEININDPFKKANHLFNIYGYGKPNLEKALRSEGNRVVLIKENKIKLRKFHIYPVYLPREFIEERGDKTLSLTLVYDPSKPEQSGLLRFCI